MYEWWNVFWIVPVAVVGLIVVRVYTYVIWSIPIWILETIQDLLRQFILRREAARAPTDGEGPASSPG